MFVGLTVYSIERATFLFDDRRSKHLKIESCVGHASCGNNITGGFLHVYDSQQFFLDRFWYAFCAGCAGTDQGPYQCGGRAFNGAAAAAAHKDWRIRAKWKKIVGKEGSVAALVRFERNRHTR